LASKRNKSKFVKDSLALLERNNLYRKMRAAVVEGPTATVEGKKVIHLCSNDYLGLARNPDVLRRAASALEEVSQCSSRLIAGNNPQISALESVLSAHRKAEGALVFPTGYMANLGAITALADKNSTILSDELNHASIIDACRLSGASVRIFRHNDIAHVEEIMRKTSGRRMVVTEGIFSMDGDLSMLSETCKIAHEYDALTVLDDAHGDFIFGQEYSGVASHLKASVDVHISSMSKGLGCFGGYVAASADIVELLVNTSKPFIFTSALPSHLCAAAVEAVKLAKVGDLQQKLFANVALLKEMLARAGFVIGNSASQIMPIKIGPERTAVEFSSELLKAGVFAQAVRYPTVKKGSARLRLSVTAAHTKAQLAEAVDTLYSIGKRQKIIG
jgi:glycine C-acetyltransferase